MTRRPLRAQTGAGRARRAAPWIAALLLCAPAAARQEDVVGTDRVIQTDGVQLEGEIKSEEYEALSIAVKGSTKRVAWDAVASVSYFDGETLSNATEAYAGGRFGECLSLLSGLLSSEPAPRPVLQQQALFFQGLCQVSTDELEQAIATFEAVLAKFPRGRFLRRATAELAGCYLVRNDAAGATAALERGLGAAQAEKDIDLVRARISEAQGTPDKARALYQGVADGGTTTTAKEEGRLGQARMLLLEGKGDEASTLFRSLTTEAVTNPVLAGAWNGLGDIWREEGRQKKDQERLMEAVFAYLRGVVQYPPAPGEPTEEYEHALGGTALVYKYLSEIEQNPEKKRTNKGTYAKRKASLEREFPNSPWLKELKDN